MLIRDALPSDAPTLIDFVIAEAREAEGAAEVRLYVHPSNTRAIRAYEKLGFEPLPYRMMVLR